MKFDQTLSVTCTLSIQGGHVQDPPQGARVHVRQGEGLHDEKFPTGPRRQSHGRRAAEWHFPQVVPQEEGQDPGGITT